MMTSVPIAHDPARSSARKKRASVACRHCQARKVRCNLIQCGPPCWNCRQDGSICEVASRRKDWYVRLLCLFASLQRCISQNTDTQVLSAGAVKRTRKQKSDSACRAATDSTTGILGKDPFPLILNPSESGQNYLDQPPSALPGTLQDTIRPQPSSTAVHYHGAQDDESQSSDIDEGDNPTAFTVIMNNTQDETPSAPFYAGARL